MCIRDRHIKGTQNVVADTLSRMFQSPTKTPENKENPETAFANTVITEFPLAFTNIALYQLQDPLLKPIIEQLTQNIKSEKYVLSKNVLCLKIRNGKELRIIAPDVIKPMLMEYFHSSTIGAHMGINKTIHRIRKEYHWNNMNSEIANFVKKCTLCALSKPARNTQVSQLISEIPKTPFSKLYLDFSGPYPRSKSRNTMLLICVDSFTKFVWMYPMRRALASTTVKILQERLFKDYGTPVHIVSDNGPQFKAKEFKNMGFKLGIDHITTTCLLYTSRCV